MALASIRLRSRFWGKAGAAVALVALGDALFYRRGGVGSAIGAFAFAWIIVTAFFRPALLRDRRALGALLFATLCAALMVDDPGLLVWTLFWIALTMATLLPRLSRFDDALRWAIRLAVHGVASLFMPLADIARLGRRQASRGVRIAALLSLLAVPVIGTALFILLFASANPLIGDLFADLRLPTLDLPRLIIWLLLGLLVWGSLRPSRVRLPLDADPGRPDGTRTARMLPGVGTASIRLSLLLFNLVFAVQNLLDLVFLWSGAALPAGVTLADYAHRGAYTLIATALLAGLFVLAALRPGSETARVPAIRRLVLIWTAQNIFLVASSMLRTIDYVEAFSLTVLRIAALLWMGLVATGLALICWRLLRNRSGAWLINANAVALAGVLSAAATIDLGAVAASWNVRHAREVGGRGAEIDLCYLRGLGPSALISVTRLERRAMAPGSAPGLRDRVSALRADILARTRRSQAGGDWTWRNARRLDEVTAMGPLPAPIARPGWSRDCDYRLTPPDARATTPLPAGTVPLTRAPAR